MDRFRACHSNFKTLGCDNCSQHESELSRLPAHQKKAKKHEGEDFAVLRKKVHGTTHVSSDKNHVKNLCQQDLANCPIKLFFFSRKLETCHKHFLSILKIKESYELKEKSILSG